MGLQALRQCLWHGEQCECEAQCPSQKGCKSLNQGIFHWLRRATGGHEIEDFVPAGLVLLCPARQDIQLAGTLRSIVWGKRSLHNK